MKIKSFVNKVKSKVAVASSIVAVSISSAHAELPVDAQAAVDSVSTFATDMITWAWPVVATVTVAGVGINLFKKFTSKAT
ncbi:phage coat protein [Marinomonas rhizomae]|uniref:Major coat protein Gp8 n=1 Tax=Marinomonas rhizomae TaxID=491948 RepID=A0A366J9Y5_9GAMM|nr:major coat protein [Marinomonas rhizomae]RBP83189.1 major coat protein Gp8 [Marinomonas rhizomae]RNF72513.1 phage coat protein [Marinomonas rhizomae]